VARDNLTTAVAESDCPIRVLRHQRLVQPTSNCEATLRNGPWCSRNSHDGLWDVGGRGQR
jgi:hypothetical protein